MLGFGGLKTVFLAMLYRDYKDSFFKQPCIIRQRRLVTVGSVETDQFAVPQLMVATM